MKRCRSRLFALVSLPERSRVLLIKNSRLAPSISSSFKYSSTILFYSRFLLLLASRK